MTTTDHTTPSHIDADRILELEQLILEDLKLREQEDAIKERRAQIKATLADQLGDGTHDLAGNKVIITRPRRLDTRAAEKALPFTEHAELYEARISTALLKHHLSPAELERFQTVGNPTVTVR